MKCVIQRVLSASVTVEKKPVSKINKGLLVLVGISREAKLEDAQTLYFRFFMVTRFFMYNTNLSVQIIVNVFHKLFWINHIQFVIFPFN